MSLKPWYGDLSASIPFYVTRKTADGETGALSCSIWMQLLVVFLVFFNLVLWGVVGLIGAVNILF